MASHGLAGVFPQETLELADRDTVGYQYLLDIAYETATESDDRGSRVALALHRPQTWNERPTGRSFESLRDRVTASLLNPINSPIYALPPFILVASSP